MSEHKLVVTDEAVWVAARAYNEFSRTRPSHPDAMHAALKAALPYLACSHPVDAPQQPCDDPACPIQLMHTHPWLNPEVIDGE